MFLKCIQIYCLCICFPAGKHTANSHKLSAFVTPAGRSYVCTAQQTFTLLSTDHQKGVTISLSDIQIQPFDIKSDFMFSEGSYSHIFDSIQCTISHTDTATLHHATTVAVSHDFIFCLKKVTATVA